MMKNPYCSELEAVPALTNLTKFAATRSMFIGCGGIGFEAVNLLKMRVMHYLGDNVRDFAPFRFLSIDSANQQFQETDLRLEQDELIRLDLTGWPQTVKEKGGVREWFPDFDNLPSDIKRRFRIEFPAAAAGCGTTRIFGRLGVFKDSFDVKLSESVKRFATAEVEESYSSLTGDPIPVYNLNDLYFFVVTSIGGGTGTGIFMDVAAIIRKTQQIIAPHQTWHIYGLLVTPTLLSRCDPSGGADKLMANSYAAMKELMHFLDSSQKSPKPFKAEYGNPGQQDRSVNLSCQDNQSSLLNVTFIIDGETQNGYALNGRMQVGNYLSGMLFKLAFTGIGEEHFQRFIDITMQGLFVNRVPVATDGRILMPQRPALSTFGWATAHMPLEEIIDHCQEKAVLEIIESLERDPDAVAPNGYQQIDSLEVAKYFYTSDPSGAKENETFIDMAGLSSIIDENYWKMQIQEVQEEVVESGLNEIKLHNTTFFSSLLDKRDEESALKELMAKSPDEIIVDLTEKKSGDIDKEKLNELTNAFVEKYLSGEMTIHGGVGIAAGSRFAAAIETAVKKNDQRFVLHGLKELGEDLDEIREKTLHLIRNLTKILDSQKLQRDECFDEYFRHYKSLWSNIRWRMKLRSDIREDLEDFIESDMYIKQNAFRLAVLQKIASIIIPRYEILVDNWYDHLDNVDASIKELKGAMRRRIKEKKRQINLSNGCDFNAKISKNGRHLFYKQFCQRINLEEIKNQVATEGFRITTGGKKIWKQFVFAVKETDTQNIIGQLKRRVIDATEAARTENEKDSGRDIFKLKFDGFTSTEQHHEIFWDNANGGDIQRTESTLLRHGCRMSKVEFNGVERKFRVFNSSEWKHRLDGDHYKSKYPHKVTYIEIAMGFAPFQMAEIKRWYRAYKKLQRAGEPLHIFQGAGRWEEPYTVYYYAVNAEKLFDLARKKRYGSYIKKTGEGTFRTSKINVSRFEGSFCKFTIQDNRVDIIEELNATPDIYEQVLKRTVKNIAKDAISEEIESIIEEGWLPENLIECLRSDDEIESTTSAYSTVKNPARLFDAAHKYGEIREIGSEGDEVYELKVSFQPTTRSCDWLVEESRETIIRELGVNELLVEWLCERMLGWIEVTTQPGKEKDELINVLLPNLPVHMQIPLQ